MYKLIIEDDEGKTTVVPLIRDEITIGRKEGNTIRLTERNVSRRHAKLSKSNGHVFIEDLQSYNGIKVNGDRIVGKATVNEGDRITIGDYQLALKMDRQASPEEPRGDEKTTPFIRDGEATSMTMKPPQLSSSQAPTALQPQLDVGAQSEQPARVVVVSSNFAGQEFPLSKQTMVIGRTDDNDVVINHRSMSRHHAQIVREGSHYHIVDLQSANGVRVNGEDYGKVELRKGDHIDLGHVRLRFIAPGEDFVFSRDAEVIDVQGGKGGDAEKSKTPMFIGIGVAVLLVGGVGIFLATRGPGGKPAGDIEAQMAKVSVEVDKAIKALQWDDAITKAEAGLALDPKNELLHDKKSTAEGEKKNQERFDKFMKAVSDGDPDAAVTLFLQIPQSSPYYEKGQKDYNNVKKRYVSVHLAAAKSSKNCDEINKHTQAVLLVDEANTDALDIAKKCGSAVAVVQHEPHHPAPTHEAQLPKTPKEKVDRPEPAVAAAKVDKPVEKPEPAEVKKPVEKPIEKAAPADDASANEAMLAKAYDEYVHGNYASALELATKANKGGSNVKAWKIIGGCACYLKDKPGAVKAWNRLDTQGKQFLKYVCSRNAIEIP